MLFDNRRVSEITDKELTSLIGNQEENQWIDFKKKEYHRDATDLEKHKREICKDVTAMANAEGGYILIGVSEKNKIAEGFFSVPDADKIAKSINDICLQSIDPRIPNLEAGPRSFEWNGKPITLVIIRIPPSSMRPHGFIWKGSTNFVKRYGDDTREYPMSELADAFSVRYHPPVLDEIGGKLDIILRIARENRRNSISSEENALDQKEVDDLVQLMKLRFQEAISDKPYYRIFAVPTTPATVTISTQRQRIRSILQNPPNTRSGGFGFTGVNEISPVPEGISGNLWEKEILLFSNGYLEYRCPLVETSFQWKKEGFGFPDVNWLYPYAVCESPVSFMRLAKAIYSEERVDSRIIVQQEYWNIEGFMLVAGHPSDPFFGRSHREWERNVYQRSHAIGRKLTIAPDFSPDPVAYELVTEIYAHFRFDEQSIPLFDENRNFVP